MDKLDPNRLLQAIVPAAGERLQVDVPAVEQASVPAEMRMAELQTLLQTIEAEVRMAQNMGNLLGLADVCNLMNCASAALGVAREITRKEKAAIRIGWNDKLTDSAKNGASESKP